MPATVYRPLGVYPSEGHAAGIELFCVGLVPGAREDIHLRPPAHVRETHVLQHPAPLCFQQSTGDSAGPEVYVVLRVLRDLLVDDDVGDLEAAAGLEHPPDPLHDRHFVRAEVDYAVADDHINGLIVYR